MGLGFVIVLQRVGMRCFLVLLSISTFSSEKYQALEVIILSTVSVPSAVYLFNPRNGFLELLFEKGSFQGRMGKVKSVVCNLVITFM